MRTCEALLLLVNSCNSASPVAPYPTPAKQPESVNRTALSKVTTPINPIKAIIIPRRMNQFKSIFGPNTWTKIVPINVCSENPAKISPEVEIDKLFRSAIHGSIGPQHVEVKPIIANATAAQIKPRLVSSRSPGCANFSVLSVDIFVA